MASKKTHCKRGHELADPNLIYVSDVGGGGKPVKYRRCKACQRMRETESRKRRASREQSNGH